MGKAAPCLFCFQIADNLTDGLTHPCDFPSLRTVFGAVDSQFQLCLGKTGLQRSVFLGQLRVWLPQANGEKTPTTGAAGLLPITGLGSAGAGLPTPLGLGAGSFRLASQRGRREVTSLLPCGLPQ